MQNNGILKGKSEFVNHAHLTSIKKTEKILRDSLRDCCAILFFDV